MKILLIEPYTQPQVIKINGSLESMQEIVGGNIEAVSYWEDNVILICNEEGKLLGLPPNRVIQGKDGEKLDIIMGTFFLCSIKEDEFCSLPDDLAEKYSRMFWIYG